HPAPAASAAPTPAPAPAVAEEAEYEDVDEGLQGAEQPEPAAPNRAPASAVPSPVSAAAPGGAGNQRPAVGGPAGSGGTRPATSRSPSGPGSSGGTSRVLSPVVRRLISEYNLDPAQIEGSGAGGRITREDVLALIDRLGAEDPASEAPAASPTPPASSRGPGSTPPPPNRGTAPAPAPQTAPPTTAPSPGESVAAGEEDTVVPFTNIRRRTAEHMVRSKHTSAHTVVAMEVDYLAVDRVRTAQAAQTDKLTYLPFIARAVIDAIAEWPHMNSSVGDDALIVHHHINLGIAVDLNFEGLLVPVIHDAADKRLRALARDIASLADRARTKRLTMDDISGGTFTLTNAGPFGTLFTVPVINQPQIAIVATDGVRKKPVVVTAADGSDAIAIHPVGNLVLAFDHRAVDGAYASAFMRAVKNNIEQRDWSSEL
ncbi:MAG: dihydrolipoamide acetyltransferase family protein, partial [Acidimicrobiales bacterium]